PIEGFVFEADDWTNPLVRRWDRYVVGRYNQTTPMPTSVGSSGLAAAMAIAPLDAAGTGITADHLPGRTDWAVPVADVGPADHNGMQH
ncbi:MAG TPA: hypothetical protein DDZ51_15410, partial [Planctomycetaceae bacterium]|nr:hypothetical protein [Planctomycetaceae bacterium]